MWLVFSYIWLPFMIIPTYAAVERVPDSLLEAAADLGARRWRTTLDVVLPLALPGVVAGSIFTFSLTLGDYITPILVGGAGSQFIGNVVYANVGIANNIPFAAALAMVPIVIMAVYLLVPQRLGAFAALLASGSGRGGRGGAGPPSCFFSLSSPSSSSSSVRYPLHPSLTAPSPAP